MLLVIFILPLLASNLAQAETTSGGGKNVVVTDQNWEQILTGEWMLKFYAPWCPACRAMEDTWHKLATWTHDNTENQVQVGDIDVTAQVALNGRFMITKLPTIYHVVDGVFRQYTAKRELEDFILFVGNEEWKELSPVSSWTSPTSFIMSSMSRLFTFSMELKSWHSHLSTEHGFPQWLSMLLFGTLIILVGLLLGIVFVLASDYFWGPPQYYDPAAVDHKKDDDAADMAMDEVGEPTVEDDGLEAKPSCSSEPDEAPENNLRQRNVKATE